MTTKITNLKKFRINKVLVEFCTTTQFDATAAHNSGFKAPFILSEGLCILSLSKDIAPCITNLLMRKRMRLFLNRNKKMMDNKTKGRWKEGGDENKNDEIND